MNELDESILIETYKGAANGENNNYKTRYGELSKALQKTVTDAITGDEYSAQSHIHIDVKSPYFYVVSDEGKRLINIGSNKDFSLNSYKNGDNGNTEENPFNGGGYYLKTNDYLPSTLDFKDGEFVGDPGSGMLIDLAGGKIDAYNFTIKGEDASEKYYGSYLKLTSNPSGPGFIDAFVFDHSFDYTYSGNHVMKLSTSNYYLRSFDWFVDGNTRQGMTIDLSEGCITSYSNSNAGKVMLFDASASLYPLQLGTIGNPNFKIGWDGALYINGDAFKVDANGNVTISQGSINIGNGAFKVDTDGSMTATKATIEGKITATSGKIGGWTIDGSNLTCGSVTLNGSTGAISGSDISGGTIDIGNGVFKVENSGALTATNATIEGKITADEGKIGGWTIAETGLSAGTLKLNSDGSIEADSGVIGGWTISEDGLTAGNLTLSDDGSITLDTVKITASGFYKGSEPYPTVNNIAIWTGFGKGGWGKISFVNGLLASYDNTGLDGANDDASVFNYSVSTTGFKAENAIPYGWGGTFSPSTGTVAADGDLSFDCTLYAPTTLYKYSSQKTVTLRGSGVSGTNLGSYAGTDETGRAVYYAGSSYYYYHSGDSLTYDTFTKYCDSGEKVTGTVKLKFTN